MRRKSERNKAKASPEKADKAEKVEKAEKAEKPKRGRPSRKRKKSSSSEEGGESPTSAGDRAETRSDSEQVWRVKTAGGEPGEPHKLKICLARPNPPTPATPSTPVEVETRTRRRDAETPVASQLPQAHHSPEERRRSRHRSRRTSNREPDPEPEVVPELEPVQEAEAAVEVAHADQSQPVEPQKPEPTDQSQKPEPTDPSEKPEPVVDQSEKLIDQSEKPVDQSEQVAQPPEQQVTQPDKPEEYERAEVPAPVELPKQTEQVKQPEQSTEITKPPELEPVVESTPIESESTEQSIPPSEMPESSAVEVIAVVQSDADQVECIQVVEVVETAALEIERKSPEPVESAVEIPIVIVTAVEDVPSFDVPPIKEDSPKVEEVKFPPPEAMRVDEVLVRVEKSATPPPHASPLRRNQSTESKPICVVRHEPTVVKNDGDDSHKVDSMSENVASTGGASSRKRKWGSRPKLIKAPSVNISTDSLKNLISNVEPVSAEEILSDMKIKDVSEVKPKKIVIDNSQKTNGKYNVSENTVDKDLVGNLSHRKISIVNEEATKLQAPPSPPKYKSSTVLYITNLVRPFTLPQLKNLLQRTGRILENGFWIDKIKSKCFVQYETEDEAIETRHALHGVTWPVSNPKTLNVDFGSKEAMDEASACTEDDKSGIVESWPKDSVSKDIKISGTELEEKSIEKRTVVREWDLGKGDGRDEFLDRHNNRHREGNEVERRKRRTKSRSPSPARKFKKKEEEAPSKLLDDLFKKTKTTPCIYWLPLNAETILVKEEQRRKHMAEHERRMEELRRAAEEHRMSRHTSHHTSGHRHR